MIWVLFEGAGSPRLNKVARQIMFTYCPFPEEICSTLAQNPIYSELLDRRKIKVAQGLHHLDVLTRKLQMATSRFPRPWSRSAIISAAVKILIPTAKGSGISHVESFFYVLYFMFSHYHYASASCLPSSLHAFNPSSSGVSWQISPSPFNTVAPAASMRVVQSLIHSPSPHP